VTTPHHLGLVTAVLLPCPASPPPHTHSSWSQQIHTCSLAPCSSRTCSTSTRPNSAATNRGVLPSACQGHAPKPPPPPSTRTHMTLATPRQTSHCAYTLGGHILPSHTHTRRLHQSPVVPHIQRTNGRSTRGRDLPRLMARCKNLGNQRVGWEEVIGRYKSEPESRQPDYRRMVAVRDASATCESTVRGNRHVTTPVAQRFTSLAAPRTARDPSINQSIDHHPAPSTHPPPSTLHPAPSTQHPAPSTQHPSPPPPHPQSLSRSKRPVGSYSRTHPALGCLPLQ
jgi:hypothetical protein